MRLRLSPIILSALLVSGVQAQHSPDSGEQTNVIKSLSQKEIDDYRSGAGMGFAKAAELNHYPGPKHVLELAAELQLTEPQQARSKEIYETMRQEAMRLGKSIVEQEKALDQLFASTSIDQKKISQITDRIAGLQGKLRAVHLAAHVATRTILTHEQIEKYDALRGHTDKQAPANQENMHKH